MKWINSTAAGAKHARARKDHTVFNCIDRRGYAFGGIVVTRSGVSWYVDNGGGQTDSVGQAKSAVEKLARLVE